MELLANLMTRVFGGASAAVPAPAGPPLAPAATAPVPKESPSATPAAPSTSAGAPVPASPAPAQAVPPPPAPAPAVVDVTEVLDGLAAKSREKLDWRKSIVDLMKLVDMDSSLAARKALAAELDYPGSTSDSAKMNVWLHKEVLKRFAANGGNVPADLLD